MSKNNLIALLAHKEWGYSGDIEKVAPYPLNTVFEVENISIGQSHSSLELVGIDDSFNTINFDFFDDDGNPVNIFKDKRFNSYLNIFDRMHDEI